MAVRAQYAAAGIARAKAAAVAGGPNPGGLASSQNNAIGTTSSATGQTNAGPRAPKAPTVPSVNPYLSPAQIASYTTAIGKDEGVINGAAGASGTALQKFDASSAANGAKAATSFNTTNQSDAARGFGFSGIHDNAMADIQANAVINQNAYNLAYSSALGTIASNVTNAQNDIGTLNQEYAGIAASNAQTLASGEGATVNPSGYTLPSAPAASTPTATTPPPTVYFNNPNMGAINAAIAQGAAGGSAAGVS